MNRAILTANRSALVVAAALIAAPAVEASEIDNDGGITLIVSFELNEDLAGTIPVPVDAPGAQAHYCDAFRKFSEELYQTTEGTHFIKRVLLFEEINGFRDVEWNYREPDQFHDSIGSYKKYLRIREKGKNGPDYYNPPAKSTQSLGELLDHEFGHYFYQLPDEYVNFDDYRGGGTGLCGATYTLNGSTADGTVCDEEEFTCSSGPCVFRGQCVKPNGAWNQPCAWDYLNGDGQETACSEDSANAGDPCNTDADCQPGIGTIGIEPNAGVCERGCGFGGICLGKNSSRDDKYDDSPDTDIIDNQNRRICRGENNLSGSDWRDRVCLMRGAGYGRRWCDGGRNGDQQVANANHNYVWPLNTGYQPGNLLRLDLGNTPGPPEPEITTSSGIVDDFLGHSCWRSAGEKHVDLLAAHQTGDPYTDFQDGMGNIPIPSFTCEWLIDANITQPHVGVVIDSSAATGYSDASDPPVPAIEQALDGALYTYNQIVPNGSHGGIYVFNNATSPATNGRNTYQFALKTAEIDGLDNPGAAGGTDLATAIDRAVNDILLSTVPQAQRAIVVVTDGKRNTGGDPYAAAERACDNGIFVWTVAFGDADSAALDRLSHCGEVISTGTEEAGDPVFAQPDPLEIKTAIARLGHRIAGDIEVLEHRASLEPLPLSTVETHDFVVPQNSDALRFSWLGNRTCVQTGPIAGICDPVLNLMVVELESPSNVVYSAGLSPGEAGGVYRTIEVTNPEPGTWTARLDKTEPAGLTVAGAWDLKVPATRVSWIGHVEHGGIEGIAWVIDPRQPVDAPVAINAQLTTGARLSRLDVLATVTHAGNTWLLRMYDDGLHFDGDKEDGTYGAIFNPDGDWTAVTSGLYRVKVRMESRQGRALTIPAGEDSGDNDVDNLPDTVHPDPGNVVVEAETSFRLSTRYSMDPDGNPVPGSIAMSCPDLVRGQTRVGLYASVHGIEVDPQTTRLSLGPDVDMTMTAALCSGCTDTSTDPSGDIFFDVVVAPDAETGPRTFYVQEQFDIVRSVGACRVCSLPGVEECNGRDDDCNGLVDEDSANIEDGDGDLVLQVCDNCPFTPNRDQSDFDMDGQGDRCDVDDGVVHTRFTSSTNLDWDMEGRSALWNVYRGDLETLRLTGEYTQPLGAHPNVASFCSQSLPALFDSWTPPAGTVAFYLVTIAGPVEGDLGDSSSMPRPNHNPCPNGPAS